MIKSELKSVGIIGGLGPETTAEFYLAVIFGCLKQNALFRPSVVISSVPLELSIENDLLEGNKNIERYIPFLVREAKRLESSGVDFLVMPCNSLHVFIDQIRGAVSIPVISILEETTDFLIENGLKKVGLVSTSATIANNVYEKTLAKNSISFVIPSELERAKMDKIIQRLIAGIQLNSDRDFVQEVVENLNNQGVDCVALACTDLQLLLPKCEKTIIFDTMKVLADSTVKYLLNSKKL